MKVPSNDASLLSHVDIRHLAHSDLPALEWGGEYTRFRRLYQQMYHDTLQGKTLMWVAELPEAGIIGQLFIQLSSSRKELADGITRAYLYGFRVKNAYRKLGLGSYLLQTVETDLVRRNYLWVTLNVGRANLEARRFYERHGYAIVAAEPGRWSYLDDQGRRRHVHEPAWRMQKRLQVGVPTS